MTKTNEILTKIWRYLRYYPQDLIKSVELSQDFNTGYSFYLKCQKC